MTHCGVVCTTLAMHRLLEELAELERRREAFWMEQKERDRRHTVIVLVTAFCAGIAYILGLVAAGAFR